VAKNRWGTSEWVKWYSGLVLQLRGHGEGRIRIKGGLPRMIVVEISTYLHKILRLQLRESSGAVSVKELFFISHGHKVSNGYLNRVRDALHHHSFLKNHISQGICPQTHRGNKSIIGCKTYCLHGVPSVESQYISRWIFQ
jgi:hypothetical protein